MPQKLLRGRILTFISEPQTPDDDSAHLYIEDGALLLEGGMIKACGAYDTIHAQAEDDVQIIDHRPCLLMAGFIDTHLHFPQVQVIASWGAQLLDWLQDYTFPAEARFADPVHGARMATHFFDELIANGTTTSVAYCSSHKASAEVYFAEAASRNMRVIGGKVMMDRNAPDNVCDTPQRGYDDSKALIADWHGKGRAHYAITPRFAITSTPEQLDASGALAREHPNCYIQTHIDENRDEINLTAKLFPEARDYLDVYEHYGLLGTKTLLGHCIHMLPREIDALVETGSRPVFCPTSNLFLGSGLFDYEGLRQRGAKCAIATDIGGGTSYSMLQTLNEGYKVLKLNGQKLHPLRAFYWTTLGNATALGLEDKIGTLDAGSEADIVVLNPQATPAMALRMETCQSLAEELFILQIMSDDRTVAQTYVAGEAMKG
ncbi:guanine deaminase [Cohaesibacter celericrescens]|uniref:Guanine deaminase n=2 Tax=Cohaesibacter celericrescens TaxID=2067669 RepID=A0A2N5XV40_9HYPH|nr:guanine deaminase [Cohaesibacter celericrescens]PLW78340.1 guanine deaminase [Cohaesibacter celericrescens]